MAPTDNLLRDDCQSKASYFKECLYNLVHDMSQAKSDDKVASFREQNRVYNNYVRLVQKKMQSSSTSDSSRAAAPANSKGSQLKAAASSQSSRSVMGLMDAILGKSKAAR